MEFFIEGRVQGVFFRSYTLSTALAQGIKGYVENMPDGTVHIVTDKYDPVFIKKIFSAPFPRKVEKIMILPLNNSNAKKLTTFVIRHC